MLFGSDDPFFAEIESSARILACVAAASSSTVTEELTVRPRHEILKFNHGVLSLSIMMLSTNSVLDMVLCINHQLPSTLESRRWILN